PARILGERRIVESRRRAGALEGGAQIRLLRARNAGSIREPCCRHGAILSFRNARNRVSAHPPARGIARRPDAELPCLVNRRLYPSRGPFRDRFRTVLR